MPNSLQPAKPRNSASRQAANRLTGMEMLLRLYSAVAKAENMTAGSVMFTATDLRVLTPSRDSRLILRHSMPSPSMIKTGKAFSRILMISIIRNALLLRETYI